MKSLTQHITEKLVLNSNSKIRKEREYNYHPKTRKELMDIIENRIHEYGNDVDLNDIDVSKITDMSYIFGNHFQNFEGDISGWDVSNAENMRGMFDGCKKFNCDISDWDVSNVEDMSWMFAEAESFNQNLSRWKVGKVKQMYATFCEAKSFNYPLNDWDVSSVLSMESLFASAESFNQPLDKWNVKNVKSMERIFFNAKSFNQDISNWKTDSVRDFTNGEFFKNCPIKEEYKAKFKK
jgi:surface protein